MSFTKITAAGIGSTEAVTLDGLSVINNESIGGNLTVTGNANIGGVLTYEDVTNVDSVGVITARAGVVVGSGITLSKDGDIFATGVTTSTTFVGNLTGAATQVTVADESSDTSCNVLYTTAASGNLAPKSGTNLTFNSSSGALTATAFSDSKGNVRSIPQNNTTGTYTLVVADAAKHVLATGTVTIPNSVFSAGDAVTIINNSGSDITLTASVGTLYNTADAATGDRTLAGRGMATVIFSSATVAYISGAGLS